MINNCSELCGACKVSSPNNRRSSNRRTPYAKLMPSSRKLSYNIAISRLARFAEGRRLGESVKKHVTLSVEVVGEPIINRSRSYQGWDRQQYSNKNSANSEFITETNFRFTRSFMEDFGEWAASFTKDWPAAKKRLPVRAACQEGLWDVALGTSCSCEQGGKTISSVCRVVRFWCSRYWFRLSTDGFASHRSGFGCRRFGRRRFRCHFFGRRFFYSRFCSWRSCC